MFDFQSILTRMLAAVSDSQDKRPSSIIFDALSPTAAELAQIYIINEIFKEQTDLLTATGDNLDRRAGDFGISRKQATFAVRIAETNDTDGNPIDLPIGSRFSTPNIEGEINYELTKNLEITGQCLLTCEIAGTIGNVFLGELLPLFVINNLGNAIMTGTQIPASDTESDEDFRERVLEQISRKSFGGNVAAYKEFVREIDGVGDVKVFPAWDGGGTVKISIIDNLFDSITQNFIDYIKNIIDPEDFTGQGIGIAPIGHSVTVSTPEKYLIRVNAIVMLSGVTIGQVQSQAEEKIREYLLSLRREWADKNELNIFSLLIASAILSVPGVINVPVVTLNDTIGDIILEQTVELQQLPYLEVLILNE